MSFEYPHLLYFLVFPVVLLVWQIMKTLSGSTLEWGKIQTRGALPESRRKLFFSLALILGLFSMARPQWGVQEQQVFDQSREVLIAVDLSRSMLAADLTPSRLERAKIMIGSLLDELRGERVGLLLFAGTAYLQSPLSPDYEMIKDLLPTLSPDWMPQGGTDYTQMLQVASDAFESGQSADRFLIILSDGESTTEGWNKVAEKFKSSGVRVIGLGLGTTTGAVIPGKNGSYVKDERGAVVMSKLEAATLQELAQITNGAYRDAAQWVDLHALVQETVDQGQQGEFKEKKREKKVERFQWFLGLSFILMLLSFVFEMPVRIKPRSMKVASLWILFMNVLCWGDSEKVTLDPLAQEVAQLSSLPQVRPEQWAELAQKTIQRGQKNPQFPEGIVEDALAGVNRGEKQNDKAADWKKLRKDLEDLLKQKKNNQNDQNQNKDQNKKDQQEQKENQDQNQKNNSSSQDSSQKNSPSENKPQDSNKDSSQNDSQKSQGEDQKKENSTSGQNQENENKDQKPEETKKDANQGEANDTQKVGGQKREVGQDKGTAISKEQLMKLNQIKQEDSPAKLFQVLQGKGKSQDQQPGKDW